MREDTIPSKLFDDDESPKVRKRTSNLGLGGILVFALVFAFGVVALGKMLHKHLIRN